jgi:glyoxylase-like metal-dependent hydrolase (beta-lactamase superfamily II)
MRVTGTLQREAWLRKELPPVERVVPGVWSVPVPIVCFHDETHGLLLTGDHVLPRITPNVSVYDAESDPLAAYLDSLEQLRETAAGEVLPAHEYRFAGLDDRLEALRDHHLERLREAVIVGSGTAGHTAWQVARQVTRSRPWSQLSAFPAPGGAR